MTQVHDRATLKWCSLREIVAHYMEDSSDRDGRSGAEVIRLCFKEKERCDQVFALSNKDSDDRLQYEQEVRELDAMVERTHARILRLVADQAKDAKWFALGRRGPETEHELVSPQYWPFLTLDVENNATTGYGIVFRDLRCTFTSSLADNDALKQAIEQSQRAAAAERPPGPAVDRAKHNPQKVNEPPSHRSSGPEDLGRNDAPGRPSYYHLIRQEFARRVEAGTIEPSLKRQAQVLADWFENTHRNLQPYQPNTIRIRLAEDYWPARSALSKEPNK